MIKIGIFDLVSIIVILILVFILFFGGRESLNAIIAGNAFTDLRCIDNSQPIVRIIDSKTFQCLSKDGTNCLKRDDYGIPPNINCRDINGFLVKSIRDMKSSSRKVFDELENKTNYNLLTCTPDGLNNENHWCGQMWKDIRDNRCQTPDGKFGFLSSPCKQMPEYINSADVGQNTSIITSSEIIASKQRQRQATNLARSRGRF